MCVCVRRRFLVGMHVLVTINFSYCCTFGYRSRYCEDGWVIRQVSITKTISQSTRFIISWERSSNVNIYDIIPTQVWRVFHLLCRLITFEDHLAHLVTNVNKRGCKRTALNIFFTIFMWNLLSHDFVLGKE